MSNEESFFSPFLTNLFDILVAPLMLALLSLSSPTQSTIYRFNFSVTHLEIRGILVLKLKTISVPGKLMNKKYR